MCVVASPRRDASLLCVVEMPADLLMIGADAVLSRDVLRVDGQDCLRWMV